MAVTFKDYYAILGVDRNADAEAVKKAYRKKARELHPDRNKAKGAEERFREVNEAYEVLGDPDKRARYDQLGANYHDGAPFEPPPDYGEFHGGSFRVNVEDLGDLFGQAGAGGGFSDFFQTLFGGGLGETFQGRAGGGRRRRQAGPRRGPDIEAELELALADLLAPTQRVVTLGMRAPDGSVERRSVTVNIPGGVRPGSQLRLPGQGAPGQAGGAPGDIYLKIRVPPEPRFQVEGDDLLTDVDLAAPLAVVGGTVRVTTLDGAVTVRVRPGTQTGTSLRIRGRGLARKNGDRGDLIVRLRVVVPEHPSEREKELYQELAGLIQPS